MNNPDLGHPLASVGLMTSGNRGRYLRGVIDSWLKQTFKDFELIISNDCSTDDTDAICKEYAKKDKRVRYFNQEKHLYNPRCYDFVLGKARGKYFIWASDDDLWHERLLEDCLAAYARDPELVMVFADMVDIDRSGNVVKKLDPRLYFPYPRDLYERLKANMLHYFDDGKNQLLYGLWKREKILDYPLSGYIKGKPWFYFGFTNHFINRGLSKGPVGLVDQVRFYRRTREYDEPRKKHFFISRFFITFYHRLGKIFASPYFLYEICFMAGIKELSPWQRMKLLFWNFYVMARIFFVRKI